MNLFSNKEFRGSDPSGSNFSLNTGQNYHSLSLWLQGLKNLERPNKRGEEGEGTDEEALQIPDNEKFGKVKDM